MAVTDIRSVTGAAGQAASAASAADSEQRFLKLLVTQLNNQDPLNPLDNAQLTSQLAQMSTVSGIEKLNAALQALLAQSGTGQVLQAASLIGRDVLVPGNALVLQAGQPVAFAIEPTGAADSVVLDIVDDKGRVVRQIDAGALPRGLHQLAWDGLDGEGQALPEGRYRFVVNASQGSTPVATLPLVFERVQSVVQGAGGPTLDFGSGYPATLGEVRLIQ
ncbi:flagellar hook assembly protein FlgD [Ramlibacter tataouinensis]|uniref:flagellar hook assembly protein FlgD n=1 Tax=Ramlibacter tataouinensis TaxID=94132 RepID=UPI0022F3B848|nr:flagellar hook assembly protein FlgD [Ramlibacter tataouinensis]WBY00592.1 flagellar hook assembly protein FlgD [Ramlibacter tataouinensis]